MDHVILTRFNLPSAGAESVVRCKPDWLADRVKLFERYCLPSVRSQTDARFRWLIYFDPDSPEWLVEKIRTHERLGYYVPVFRTAVSNEELGADIAELFESPGDELVTTNLDNDDALAADFIERLHGCHPPPTASAYYLTNGLVRTGDRLYLHRDRRNAYPSVRASWQSPITCWADWHNRLSRHLPAIEIGGAPGWLQVVHGSNVSNRTRGQLASPAAYRALFGELLDGMPEPGPHTITRDRVLGHPRRVARDLGRKGLKTLATQILGANGFERGKHLIARLTH